VTVVGGLGTILAAINGAIALMESVSDRVGSGSDVELVDVGFTQVKQEPTNIATENCGGAVDCTVPALDFKLTNSGDSPVIIERADIRVKKIWTFKAPYVPNPNNICYGAALLPSFNYEVKLPTKGAPYTVSKSLSQSIGPSKPDRFTITLRRDERTAILGEDYVFLVTASLVYGTDDTIVTATDVLYGESHRRPGSSYSYQPGECWMVKRDLDPTELAKLRTENRQAAAEIRRIEAPRNASLKALLREVS
jgi:hypothetical protein